MPFDGIAEHGFPRPQRGVEVGLWVMRVVVAVGVLLGLLTPVVAVIGIVKMMGG